MKRLMTTSLLGLLFISVFTYSQNDSNKIFNKEIVINTAEMKEHHLQMTNMTMNDSNKTITKENIKNHMPIAKKTMMDSCKMMNNPEHKKMMGKMKDHMNMDNKAMMDSCKMMMNNPDHKKMMGKMKDHMNMHDKSKMKSSKKINIKDKSSIVQKGVIDLVAIDINKDGKVYQDVMDWNVISDKPGACPLCGMKLREVTLEKAKDNLLKNGFKVKDSGSPEAINKNSQTNNDNLPGKNNIKTVKKTWNKYCPVTGMKVNPKSETVEYDGMTIGFCCAGSEHYKTFLEAPEKYMKNLSSDGQNFIGNK